MINFSFNEQKATEAACHLLKFNNGKMNYMKLVKLLYLADRKALEHWGRTITGDSFVSLNHGTILSTILNIIRHDEMGTIGIYWKKYITKNPPTYEVSIISDPGINELCKAEIELLEEIFKEFKDKNQWDMRDYCHQLPEWTDPHGSAIPIQFEEILKCVGKTPQEISAIDEEICAADYARRLFGC